MIESTSCVTNERKKDSAQRFKKHSRFQVIAKPKRKVLDLLKKRKFIDEDETGLMVYADLNFNKGESKDQPSGMSRTSSERSTGSVVLAEPGDGKLVLPWGAIVHGVRLGNFTEDLHYI